jgi:hypothetical protein
VVPVDNILFASEMIGAVKGIDPETGHHFDDTKRYVDQVQSLSADDRYKIFEGNAAASIRASTACWRSAASPAERFDMNSVIDPTRPKFGLPGRIQAPNSKPRSIALVGLGAGGAQIAQRVAAEGSRRSTCTCLASASRDDALADDQVRRRGPAARARNADMIFIVATPRRRRRPRARREPHRPQPQPPRHRALHRARRGRVAEARTIRSRPCAPASRCW